MRFWKSNYCNMHIPLYLIIRSAAPDHYSGIYWAKPFLCIHLQNNPVFCLIISLCTARNSVNGAFMPALALVIDSGSESAIWSVEVETRSGLIGKGSESRFSFKRKPCSDEPEFAQYCWSWIKWLIFYVYFEIYSFFAWVKADISIGIKIMHWI